MPSGPGVRNERKRKALDPTHTCHVPGCDVVVPPALLMCRAHWLRVPYELKLRVWAEYQEGQELFFRGGTVKPTGEYIEAAKAAIASASREQDGSPRSRG